MYVSQEQVFAGIVEYAKHEVMPALPEYARLIAGAALLHNANRLEVIVKELAEGSVLRSMDVVTAEGQVDIDEWCSQLKRSMSEYCNGKVEIKLPLISPVIFRENDIDLLKNYIRR